MPYIDLANTPDINERVNHPHPYTEADFEAELKRTQEHPNHFVWMIEQDGTTLGVINSAALRHPKIFQGGYWLHPDHRGKGLATAALTTTRDFLFQTLEAERIQAVVEPSNLASINVLEKCSYVREGLMQKFYPTRRRGLIDICMYACLR